MKYIVYDCLTCGKVLESSEGTVPNCCSKPMDCLGFTNRPPSEPILVIYQGKPVAPDLTVINNENKVKEKLSDDYGG